MVVLGLGLISVNHLLNITAEIDLSRAQSEVEEAVRKMTEETEQLRQQARTALKLGSKVEVSCGSCGAYKTVCFQTLPAYFGDMSSIKKQDML